MHDTVSAMCTVTKGDTPIDVWWIFSDVNGKNKRNITTKDGVLVTRAGLKISAISIDSANARHCGNYTCFAKNRAGITSYSAQLLVNGDDSFLQKFPTSFLDSF